MDIIPKIIHNYFRHDANGDVFSTEVLIKSSRPNTPPPDRSDTITFPLHGLVDLERLNLPVPSFGAFRIGPTDIRFVPF